MLRTLKDHLYQCPSKLSEEMVRCMAAVYCWLRGAASVNPEKKSITVIVKTKVNSLVHRTPSTTIGRYWSPKFSAMRQEGPLHFMPCCPSYWCNTFKEGSPDLELFLVLLFVISEFSSNNWKRIGGIILLSSSTAIAPSHLAMEQTSAATDSRD
ncbi:hypothetical protein CK203_093963 [Vitis vinifera]|uniref:Uncharacterized protein n=1 Tax=Vitis vinifera TaxID=29760 RepID=A0A438CKD6_VITVI|nr:hypothetical protein CK203_093963 [Vitis vinifera]